MAYVALVLAFVALPLSFVASDLVRLAWARSEMQKAADAAAEAGAQMADIAAWLRLTPRFCDVSRDTLAPSVADVEACMNERTALILVIHPIVHLADIDGFTALAAKWRLPLLFRHELRPGSAPPKSSPETAPVRTADAAEGLREKPASAAGGS